MNIKTLINQKLTKAGRTWLPYFTATNLLNLITMSYVIDLLIRYDRVTSDITANTFY